MDVTWLNGNITTSGGMTITNAGTWLIQTNGYNSLWQPDRAAPFPILANTGTIIKEGTGRLDMNMRFDNDGAIDLRGGSAYLGENSWYFASPGVCNSTGMIAGAVGTELHLWSVWDITGAVDSAGTVSFDGPGTSIVRGDYSVHTTHIGNATVSFTQLNPLFENLTIAGGTLATNGDTAVNGLFTWSGGLVGAGSLRADGGTVIRSGYLDGGFDYLNPVGALVRWTGTGNVGVGNGSILENAGTLELWTDAFMGPNGPGGTFLNSGLLRKRGGSTAPNLFYGSLIGVPTQINTGTIDVQVGTLGLGYIGTTTDNQGSITTSVGTTLWLLNSLTSSGSVDTDYVRFHIADATITGTFRADRTELYDGSSTVRFPGTVLGLGDVVVGSNGGGTLDLTGATFAEGATTLDALTVNGGRLITGEDITVTGLFAIGGVLRGVDGEGSLTAVGGSLIRGGLGLEGGFDYLNPVGSLATWNTGGLGVGAGSVLENAGTMELWTDAGVGGDGQFLNTGTFRKVGGSTTPNLFYGSLFSTALTTNSGAVELNVGTMGLGWYDAVVVNTGTITAAPGTTLWMLFTHQSPGDIDAEYVRFHVADATITGSFRADRTELYDGSSTARFPGTVLGLGDVVVGSNGGGTLDLTGATFAAGTTTLPSLSLNGTLITSADLTVTGAVSFNGTLRGVGGQGSLVAFGGGVISGLQLQGGFDITNPQGQTITWSGGLGMGGGSDFTNAGTLNLTGDHGIFSDATATFHNTSTGQLIKVGGSTSQDLFYGSPFQVATVNDGLIRVDVGTIGLGYGNALLVNHGSIVAHAAPGQPKTTVWLLGGVTSDGSIDADRVRFHGDGASGIATITGPYKTDTTEVNLLNVRISGEILKLGHVDIGNYGGGPLDLTGATFASGATTLDSLSLNGGTLISSANLSVAGPFVSVSATLAGAGSLTANGGSTLSSNGLALTLTGGFDFTNPAGQLVSWTGAGRLSIGTGSVFENAGTMELWTDAGMSGSGEFRNSGTFIKRDGSTHQDLFYGSLFYEPSLLLFNSGILRVDVGTLGFGNMTNSGSIIGHAAAGQPKTTIWFSGSSTGVIDADRVRFNTNDATIAGTYRTDRTQIYSSFSNIRISGTILDLGDVIVGDAGGGTLDLTGATFAGSVATLDSLTVNGGTLLADGDLAVAGAFTWPNGTLRGVGGAGSLTVLNDHTLSGTHHVRDFNLINAADMIWTDGTVNFYGDGSRFTNLAGATFEDRIGGNLGSVDNNCPVFDNRGLFRKTSAAPTTLHLELYNSGSVQITQGILNIHCGVVQVTTITNSGTSTGTISGNFTGDVSTAIVNSGTVTSEPTPISPPPVTNFTQTATGNLTQIIGGLTPGTQYGQIIVNGNISLAGSLAVVLTNNFLPSIGDSFTIIDNRGTEPVVAHFLGLDEATDFVWAGRYGFTINYSGGDGNDVVLTMSRILDITVSGRVFDDRNNDGIFNGIDEGIAGIEVMLVNASNTIVDVRITGADGKYTFRGLYEDGTYKLVATKAAGYLDGRETAGSHGGTVDNSRNSDAIGDIVLHAADIGSGYDFAEIRPSRIQGLVWEDANNNGEVDLGELAIEGVALRLTGTNDRNQTVDLMLTTDGQGIYEFAGLRPGVYSIIESQPANFVDGLDSLGTVDGAPVGTMSNDRFDGVVLSNAGSDGVNYNFGELRPVGGGVHAGQTASIGFWQNKNGQALIKSLNAGVGSARLGNWLAQTFPNLYGAGAGGNTLAGKTNAQVAAIYVSLFKRNGQMSLGGPPKLDAQVMATALAVYVTNEGLAGTAGVAYGFEVTTTGVGYSTFNVGTNGAAFGVANGTTLSVLELLQAVDARTRNGLIYDLDGNGTIDQTERGLRTMANDVFAAINELGDIGG